MSFIFVSIDEFMIQFAASLWLWLQSHVNAVAECLSAVIGSFAGAYFAFKYAQLARRAELEDRDVRALNNAILKLAILDNDLTRLQQILLPFKNRADKWYALPPFTMEHIARFDCGELVSLLETRDAATLPLDADVAFQKHYSLVSVCNERYAVHLKVQDALARDNSSWQELERTLYAPPAAQLVPQHTLHLSCKLLKQFTKELLDGSDDALQYIMELQSRLQAAGKRRFPRRNFAKRGHNRSVNAVFNAEDLSHKADDSSAA